MECLIFFIDKQTADSFLARLNTYSLKISSKSAEVNIHPFTIYQIPTQLKLILKKGIDIIAEKPKPCHFKEDKLRIVSFRMRSHPRQGCSGQIITWWNSSG
jgi:hypothetical protein